MTTETTFGGHRIFVTGGAGFIGSRLVRQLSAKGAELGVYDNLLAQVHGPSPSVNLPAQVTIADVRDGDALSAAITAFKPTMVVHLAAETGTGQSADEPVRYVDVNVGGTARLIEAMRRLDKPPQRVVLAATRAVYGESAYRTATGDIVIPSPRRPEDMAKGIFDVHGADGATLTPERTLETMAPAPSSVYGSSKLMQEYLLLQVPAAWNTTILRLQNVYGPGQSLRNPYTGVLSIFCQQAMAGKTLNIYEDGLIYRDFVFIDDVVSAFVAACADGGQADRLLNVGTGHETSILSAARMILTDLCLPDHQLTVTGDFRAGDVRYAVADISRTLAALDWTPRVSFAEGVAQLVNWAKAEARL
ncbi:NAD-dependent epimerase/dehydratase family protein [Neorhizobium sp. AL 9.2.2]|uniref:NAD-dependent epimerase/dehydratase family protein n=1 Tax=Neorhizobium sp. AL 9.2.2 TaxID=2712894 RepID=UPI001574DDF8|nr:NAD-dependent epimerase/dehydratase family protein [Neorhizobium sp. AL 9.2.2]NSY19757.1 NAD-dependent epimerase/dehydratase family protein [Neorhizobium sp. AL 9.2.2]